LPVDSVEHVVSVVSTVTARVEGTVLLKVVAHSDIVLRRL